LQTAGQRGGSTAGGVTDPATAFRQTLYTVATGLKCTPDAVRLLDWADVVGLIDYWTEFPPEHILLRGFVGYKPAARRDNVREQSAIENVVARMSRSRSSMPKHILAELEAIERSPTRKPTL
jgi:hypothetical protein